MENLSVLFEASIGKHIILWDLEDRRYEGVVERVFIDFVQIFETRQKTSRVFKFSAIKNFSIGEK